MPTANRPKLLKVAIASVLNQTGGHLIKEIIVSENGQNRDSQAVCESFGDARIKYEYLDPAQPHPARSMNLYGQASADYVATLHDDDWWFPGYLQRAYDSLKTYGTEAFFCDWNFYTSETICEYSSAKNYALWFGSGFPAVTAPWNLSPKQLALGSLPCTPIHLSTGLWKRETLNRCFTLLTEFYNPYDCDRLVAAEIARYGGITFSPEPLVCIRHHQQQDGKRFSEAMREPYVTGTTKHVIALCNHMGVDIRKEIDELIRQCPPAVLLPCMRNFHPFVIAELERQNLIGPKFSEWLAWDKKRKFNKRVARWIPPVITEKI